MKSRACILVSVILLVLSGCGGSDSSSIRHDFDTPEGAVLCLEDAYRAKDIEAAVRCKDFTMEATLMLQRLQTDSSGDPKILAQTAELLELGFRSEMKNSDFPDFRDIVSTFSDKNPFQGRDDIVELTEKCRHADGRTTTNKLVVAKTANGWKVVTVPD